MEFGFEKLHQNPTKVSHALKHTFSQRRIIFFFFFNMATFF